jgi:hypothetical protein
MRRAFLAALATIALPAGCGGGGGGTSDAVDLTKWLPGDATSYRVADVSQLKEDLGLPEDANPVDPFKDQTQDAAMQILAIFLPAQQGATTGNPFKTPLVGAIDPPAITAAAEAALGTGPHSPRLAVLETTADTGEVGSALGDLGYTDVNGILVPPHDSGGAPSVWLEDSLIFASTDLAALRSIPDDPADALPLRILGEVDGTGIVAVPAGDLPAANEDCVEEYATAGDGDEGEIAFIVDGEAQADRFSPADNPQVEAVDVNGDLLVAHVDLSGHGESAEGFAASALANYDCG